MASKFIFVHLVLALAMLAVRLEAGRASTTVHFIDTVSGQNPAPINLQIQADDIVRGSTQLKPQQTYEIEIVKIDDVYSAAAVFGLKFTAFNAYEPARDKGYAAVYWRADNDGFSFSHDNTHYKLVAPWQSE